MAKPDPALLDPARYPYSCGIATRFADLDTNMHVNNVALVSMLEDSRVRFHAACGFHVGQQGWTSMVASLAIEYLAQAHYPEPLEVHCAAASVGRTSYRICQLVCQSGQSVAFSQGVMVCVREGQPHPLPQSFIESAKPWMLRL
jgi:acyl-CoA thioester hydrolase